MNTAAQRHLDKAAGYVAKGEGWYRKAAEEIIAAQQSDPALSNREIGKFFGKGDRWVRVLVRWSTTASSDDAPLPYSRSTDPTVEVRNAKLSLSKMSNEEVEKVIESLPNARKAVVARAAANVEYRKARKAYEKEEANLTPAQIKEREAAAQALARPGRRVAAGFGAMGIANHLEQATEDLRQLVSDGELTAEIMEPVQNALLGFLVEYNVAAAMSGLDVDLDGMRS